MPNLTITLTQPRVDRVLASFPPGSTVADVQDWIKAQLKSRVQHVEANDAKDLEYNSIGAEDWDV